MIKIQKRPLPKFVLPASVFLVILAYGALPAYTVFSLEKTPVKLLVLFYLALLLTTLYFLNRYFKTKEFIGLQIQNLQEKINIVNDQNTQYLKHKTALQQKISRYNSLKDIIEEINKSLSIDAITTSLANIAFSTIANNKGVCILYLVDPEKQFSLLLSKARKEDKKLIIKAKQGDIFDQWVLRHGSPLLVEDTRKDFRFDLDKVPAADSRQVGSLISAPFISESGFFGVLRLDYPHPSFYTQDDLRLLMAVCDLGAVAIENGELYKKTEDFAIRDWLTSLYAKGYFLERLKEECRRATRQGGVFTLLMLDIDNFKTYNDKFGHTAGDVVLRELSQAMVNFLKGHNPIISRFGGEEFCVILNHVNKKDARNIAEGLRARIESTEVILRRQKTGVTVSIGVAAFPVDAADETEIIIKADRAMYKAKQKGKNRVIEA